LLGCKGKNKAKTAVSQTTDDRQTDDTVYQRLDQ